MWQKLNKVTGQNNNMLVTQQNIWRYNNKIINHKIIIYKILKIIKLHIAKTQQYDMTK